LEDDARQVRVVRFRPAELIVRDPGPEGTVDEVLQLSAPPDVAEEDAQLPVRAELDHAAVVVPSLRLRKGAERRRHRREVLLDRPQPDQVPIEGERRAVPDEAVNSVAEQRRLAHHRRIGAGRALGPEQVHAPVRRKVGVERDPEHATLGAKVDREIEHRRMHDPVYDSLDLTAVLLENEQVVGTEERDARR
jgi:hypothetical protein